MFHGTAHAPPEPWAVLSVSATRLAHSRRLEHDSQVSQSRPEPDDVEAWRVLQEVLEERDREWWTEPDGDGA